MAQECPKQDPASAPSAVRALEGQLIYHDDLRQWFELRLDSAVCGETSIQLFNLSGKATPLETLRGCRVRTRGKLDLASTGYHSLNVYQDVDEIEAVGTCVRQPKFADYSKARPAPRIRQYRVSIHIRYGISDDPVEVQVTSAGKTLQPWQSYASYWLTGGFTLYGQCAMGFDIDRVFGTPQARPSHFDNQATYDPESAASAGVQDLRLGYTCVRAK